jgi:release factor glutamine methyltransferase
MKIRDALVQAADALRRAGAGEPRLDAEVLLASCLRTGRAWLAARPEAILPDADAARFRAMTARRAAGEPVAWITGEREFFGLPFRVRPGVFVPRPETEGLVERALRALEEAPGGRFADACTGCGCVAVSVARGAPGAVAAATDLSVRALSIARWNALRLGACVDFRRGDLLSPLLEGSWAGTVDVVCANPPYVPRREIAGLPREVLREPRRALDGGEDGLDAVRRLAFQASALLRPGGSLFVEIGESEGEGAAAAARAAGFRDASVERDLSGVERYLSARR